MRRKTVFVPVASDHGVLIVNRFDWKQEGENSAVGVGIQLLEKGSYQMDEIETALGILELRRRYFGDGVIAIDGGANIGVHTVEWAKAMTEYGQVVAIEPQERIFYALAGNICLNNCFNACAIHAAISNVDGVMNMPVPDYTVPANFGGLSIKTPAYDIGQEMTNTAPIRTLKLDSLGLSRVDFIKLDIQGMEIEALDGAKQIIDAFHPAMMIEFGISDQVALLTFLKEHQYVPFQFGENFVCVHKLDRTFGHLQHLHTMQQMQTEERAA